MHLLYFMLFHYIMLDNMYLAVFDFKCFICVNIEMKVARKSFVAKGCVLLCIPC